MGRFVPQIEALAAKQRRRLPDFRVGDNVRVHYRIHEGDKERIQVFEGTVIRRSGGGVGATFCVRKRSGGVGVERIFPRNSPRIEKLEIVTRNRVRRARLYYLRELQGKAARLQALRIEGDLNAITEDEPPAEEPATAEEAAPEGGEA